MQTNRNERLPQRLPNSGPGGVRHSRNTGVLKRERLRFLLFAVRWIGNNLAVPFWVVGHVHLTVNVYHDLIEILASCGMNLVVLIALWLDYKDSNNT